MEIEINTCFSAISDDELGWFIAKRKLITSDKKVVLLGLKSRVSS